MLFHNAAEHHTNEEKKGGTELHSRCRSPRARPSPTAAAQGISAKYTRYGSLRLGNDTAVAPLASNANKNASRKSWIQVLVPSSSYGEPGGQPAEKIDRLWLNATNASRLQFKELDLLDFRFDGRPRRDYLA